MAEYQWGPGQMQLLLRRADGTLVRVPGDWANQTFIDWGAVPGNTPDLDPDDVDLHSFPSRAQAQSAMEQADTDLATLGGTPTNAQVVAILRRSLQNQRAIIRALTVLVYRNQ